MSRLAGKVLVIILMLIALSAFALGCAITPTVIEDNEDNNVMVESYGRDILEIESYHDLSSDGSVQVSDYVQASEVFFVPALLSTNSHKITVENRSGNGVTIYLFSESDNVEPIRHMTIANCENETLYGLTSRFQYTIRIVSDVQTQLDVTITD